MLVKKSDGTIPNFLEKLSAHVTKASGSNAGIIIAFSLIIIWASLGSVFDKPIN